MNEGLFSEDFVFFHLIPDESEVLAVSDLCFQTLYRIVSALLEISVLFLIWSRGEWKSPIARFRIERLVRLRFVEGLLALGESLVSWSDIKEINVSFFLLINFICR